MNIDDIEEKEPADENRSEKDGDVSERYCTVLATDLKVDTATQIEKQGQVNDADGLVETDPVHHQQRMSNGNLAFWERFLNVRSIKVLLVENDDSTRYVVTALLRNCNYEVLNAANGMQAWKILEDLSNHVDIILTEVVMPILSGIGLLHKIMSHKTRKNTPVIMMSSHDSMGLIFKCLSRGAVDFLVKPIRKNELKILWQHVWRRCHSSSGSGSESGTQAQKYLKSNSSEKSGDNSENDGSNEQNIGDGSDDGSGAQSSWTRQAVEVDSSRAVSPTDQIAKCADSTCAQVIPSNAEKIDNIKVQPCLLSRDGLQHKQHDNAAENDKDLDTIAQRTVETKSGDPAPEPNNSSLKEPDSMTEVANRININRCNDDGKESSVEVSLKRLRGIQDTERYPQEDRCVLRRSEQSAFSRYNTSKNASKTPNEITGSSTVIDNRMDAAKRESVEGTHLHQFSYGVSNTVDMGSTTSKLPTNNYEGTSTVIMDQPSSNHPESSSMKLTVDASLCGSTNALSRAMDVEDRHYGFDKSNSRSNHASNGATGSNPATNTAGNNAESGVDQAGKSGNGDASGSVSGNRDDESRLKRAAAIIKLRQKRKERGFKKRVQYQNRKKLAEQRHRFRGQFAKRTETDSSHRTGDDEI